MRNQMMTGAALAEAKKNMVTKREDVRPTPKLGTGGRFAALKSKLAGKKGVTDPGALAATIGREKYGSKEMAKLSARGRSARAKA